MESKIWFNVDKVTKIELGYEYEIERTFFPSEPTGRFKFLWLIPLWKKDDLPDRWVNNDHLNDTSYDYNYDSSYRDSSLHRIQEFPKKLFSRAWVRVSLGYKDEVSSRFDSDQEAEDFVNLVLSKTDHVFEVIKRKKW